MELSSIDRARTLFHVRLWIVVFMLGLFVSGVTAFPLETELGGVVHVAERWSFVPDGVLSWLRVVHEAVQEENATYPFLAYGTDWLAFAHLVLALLFLGPYRDPVRNKWVLQFGMIACAGVLPLALIAGPIRGVPVFWRLVDCSFGVFGAMVLWPVLKAVRKLEVNPG